MQTRQHHALTYGLELWVIRLRDLFRPPRQVLIEAGVRAGMTVLAFGCGPGGFSLAAAKIAGPKGRVLAFDIQPPALEIVRRRARRPGLGNVAPLHAIRVAEVATSSVDIALLYDVLHIHPDPIWRGTTVASMRRVLKPAGVLSVRDHHLSEAPLLSLVTGDGLFRHLATKRRSCLLQKVKPARPE